MWFKWTDLFSEFNQLVSLLEDNFAFGDHSFTRLAAARWQDSMSRWTEYYFF